MKRIQKWSPLCLPIVLIVGIVVGWMVAQQVSVTPSEAQMGPGSQPPGPPMQGPPPKLHAAPAPPPEEQEMGPPPDQTPRKRPTKQELLEKIRQMPGGKEMLEEAKKRGARIGMKSEESGTTLSWLNPFKIKEAEAQSSFSVTVDVTNNWYAGSPSYSCLRFYGALAGYSYTGTTSERLYPKNISSTGTQIVNPYAWFRFGAPADGWYIVNIEATGANASMKHYSGGTYPTLQSWSYSGSAGTLSYPVLVELTTGYHYFYWVSSTSAYVYEANAYSL